MFIFIMFMYPLLKNQYSFLLEVLALTTTSTYMYLPILTHIFLKCPAHQRIQTLQSEGGTHYLFNTFL